MCGISIGLDYGQKKYCILLGFICLSFRFRFFKVAWRAAGSRGITCGVFLFFICSVSFLFIASMEQLVFSVFQIGGSFFCFLSLSY